MVPDLALVEGPSPIVLDLTKVVSPSLHSLAPGLFPVLLPAGSFTKEIL